MHVRASSLLGLSLVAQLGCSSPRGSDAQPIRLCVAETSGRITCLDLDRHSGDMAKLVRSELAGPSLQFLASRNGGRVLVGIHGDRLQSYRLDPVTSSITLIGDVGVGVQGTHVELDWTGRFAFVASYGGHAVTVSRIGDDGILRAPHVHLGRAAADGDFRNAHQVRVRPDNRFVYVPCLGADRIAVLAFDASTGALTPSSELILQKGSGPRHLDFHPRLEVAYVLNERSSTIAVLALDADSGALTMQQLVHTQPGVEGGGSRSSDVHVAADGRFVYAINREPRNDLAVFAVEPTGSLRLVQNVATGGQHARSFAMTGDGRHLFVGHTRTPSLVHFTIADDGRLTAQPRPLSFEKPVFCVCVIED